MIAADGIWIDPPGPIWLWFGAALAYLLVCAVTGAVDLVLRFHHWRLRRAFDRRRETSHP